MRQFPWGWQGWHALFSADKAAQGFSGPTSGSLFPGFKLAVLGGDADRDYLGLSPEARFFSLEESGSPYLFLEVYHEMCTTCQKQVSEYNRFFQLVANEPVLAARLRVIGLGMGGLRRAVIRFRKEHAVPFPLFADQRKDIFRRLGEPTLPALYLLKKRPDRSHLILIDHQGHEQPAETLFSQIKTAITVE